MTPHALRRKKTVVCIYAIKAGGFLIIIVVSVLRNIPVDGVLSNFAAVDELTRAALTSAREVVRRLNAFSPQFCISPSALYRGFGIGKFV